MDNTSMTNNEFILSHVEWLRGDHENCNPFLAEAIEKLLNERDELKNQNDSLEHTIEVLKNRVSELLVKEIEDV